MAELLLSLGVVAVFLLGWGAWRLWPTDRRRAVLMAVAGAVILVNIWLWSTMPAPASP